MATTRWEPFAATFSIAARSPRGDAFGIAVCTAVPAVGALVPWVSLSGAIATQSYINSDLGRHGIALLEKGVPIHTALGALLEADEGRAHRQVHGVDALGNTFAFSGDECVDWYGHIQGDGYTIAGNMLVGEETIRAMADAYEGAPKDGDFAENLLLALEAGQAAGGDKRGKQSAALLVAASEPAFYHNLRVDDHPDPVAELRRIFELTRESHRQRVGVYKEKRTFPKPKW